MEKQVFNSVFSFNQVRRKSHFTSKQRNILALASALDYWTNFKGSFICTVNLSVFVSGTFDIFDVAGKQQHSTALNPFLNGTKTVTSTVCANGPWGLMYLDGFYLVRCLWLYSVRREGLLQPGTLRDQHDLDHQVRRRTLQTRQSQTVNIMNIVRSTIMWTAQTTGEI